MLRVCRVLLLLVGLCGINTSLQAAIFDLVPGASASGTLTWLATDYYRIQLTQAGTLTLYTTGNTDTVGRLSMLAPSIAIVDANDDDGFDLNFRIVATLAAGTYILDISEWEGAEGSYSLHSAFTPVAGSAGSGAISSTVRIPWQQDGVRFNQTSAGASSNTRFGIGLTLDGGSNFVTNATSNDSLQVLGLIQPDPAHVGRRADIFVVDRTNSVFTMRNLDGFYVNWNSEVADLVPAQENVLLESLTSVVLHSGRISVGGNHQFFLGYMLDGQLYYTLNPLMLDITAGAGSSSGTGSGSGNTGTGSTGTGSTGTGSTGTGSTGTGSTGTGSTGTGSTGTGSTGTGSGSGTTSARIQLTTDTSGTGEGMVSPRSGQYAKGEVVTVSATPNRYSYFHSWTSASSSCVGGNHGCRITVGDKNLHMQARFDPTTWVLSVPTFTFGAALNDSTQCTWQITWSDLTAKVTWRKQTDGTYKGSMTVTGRRTARNTKPNCNPGDETINKTFNIDASPNGFSVRFLAYSGGGFADYIRFSATSLDADGLLGVGLEYTGANRVGSYSGLGSYRTQHADPF